MASNQPVDVAAIVSEIQAEVSRKRAAGEYPAGLLSRLQAEFRVGGEEEPPEALALIQPSRPLRSDQAAIGPAIVFAKRLIRRLIAWYVQPVADDQTRFNTAVVRELRRVERRLQRVETPWSGAVVPPGPGAGSASARAEELRRAMTTAPPGPRWLLGTGPVLAELAGDDCQVKEGDPFEHLGGATTGSLSAVVLAGVLPRLSAAELLRVIPLAARCLRGGGVVVTDAPRPGHPGLPPEPASVDVTMVRWLSPDVVELLCQAAGLDRVVVSEPAAETGPWYTVAAHKPG
jgi:hypothetical protein